MLRTYVQVLWAVVHVFGGLFDQLTVNLVVQVWVIQPHLQGILDQRDVVVDGCFLSGNSCEEKNGL